MKRAETTKVLRGILQQKESELAALEASISSLRIAIQEVELADDSWFTKPQSGTFKQEITDAMYDALKDGPLHRKVIMEKLKARGIYVGGGVRTVGAYLSVDDQFKNVGKGIWTLEPPSVNGSLPSDVEPDPQIPAYANPT